MKTYRGKLKKHPPKGKKGKPPVPEEKKLPADDRNKKPELILGEPMSADYVAAQLRQAAKILNPVISNLDTQNRKIIQGEIEKVTKRCYQLADFISEAASLGKQGNLFAEPEVETVRLDKTLFSQPATGKEDNGLEKPDFKKRAAGERTGAEEPPLVPAAEESPGL